MPKKLLIVVSALLAALISILVVVARRSRTQHPPVSPRVPRVEDVRGIADVRAASDDDATGTL